MNASIKSRWPAVLVFVLALVLLTAGFYANVWRAAGKKWFTDWQKFQEHIVVARLVQSRQTGVLSHGALLGYGDITTWEVNNAVIEHEYQLFLEGGQFSAYWPYRSVPGFQAIIFSLVERYSGLAPATSLKLFRFAEAVLAAVVLGFFLVWILDQFGLAAALLCLAFMTASEWLTLFGSNIYWNLWAFYLPLVALCFYLERSEAAGRYRIRSLFWIMAVTLFLKGLFNGFEFVSTALVMPFAALFYQAIRYHWKTPDLIRRFFFAAAGALAGISAALGVLVAQISNETGGWGQALGYVAHTFGKRSFGDPSQYAGLEAESLRADVFSVLRTYLDGRALNLGGIFHVDSSGLEFNYLQIIALFAFFSLLFLLVDRLSGGFPQRRTAYALLAATWLSSLAPLSWFVLFKAHAYIHTQMDFIIWQMPFCLFGFSFCGFVLARLFHNRTMNKAGL